MATGNFFTANASATFVVDYGDDEWAWQDCQELLGEDIKHYLPEFEPDTDLTSARELRSFPSSSIGYLQDSITFLNIEWEFRVSVFLRSGYYEAANLDYEVEFCVDGCDYFDSYGDAIEEITNYPEDWDINQGILAIHKSNLESKLDDLQTSMINQIESAFAKVSTPYGVVAQFSNGETIYEKLEA